MYYAFWRVTILVSPQGIYKVLYYYYKFENNDTIGINCFQDKFERDYSSNPKKY
jgi:hypothetical protein